MASLLSKLFDKLVEVVHKIKFKDRHGDKKCESCGIKYKFF